MQPLTPAENYLMKDQLGHNGNFYKSLMFAIRVADTENRAKLALAFPDLVEVIRRFQNEDGYFQDLCVRWNHFNPNHKIAV